MYTGRIDSLAAVSYTHLANENRNFTEVLDCTIIAYSFLRNGYNYCLASVFRKMEFL